MVGEMVKNRVGQGCMFYVTIPVHHTFIGLLKVYFIKSIFYESIKLNIVLVKLKNHHTSACLKLNYCTAKHKPKM